MPQSEPVSPVSDSPDDVMEQDEREVEPSFGWNAYSELVNGRVAMLAVLGIVILEVLTGQDVFAWLGLR